MFVEVANTDVVTEDKFILECTDVPWGYRPRQIWRGLCVIHPALVLQ